MIIPLDNKAERPILLLDEIFEGCTALLDTGALIPMWTKSPEAFTTLYPDAKIKQKKARFSGFGGETVGQLYQIDFQLRDLFYPQMHIMVCQDDNIPGYFLFSATMFSKMNYTIDNLSYELKICPHDNQKCFNLVVGDSVLSH